MRFYDTQIKIRRIQVIFQEEEPEDKQAPQPRHF